MFICNVIRGASQYRDTALSVSIKLPIIKIRRSHDRLIFILKIPIPGKAAFVLKIPQDTSSGISDQWCVHTCAANPHDDVIKWKHFPRYWPFVRGIHRSPVNSPHKGQWRGALMFSLICVWINAWVNNGEAGDLRRYCAHYDVTVMDTQKRQYRQGDGPGIQWRRRSLSSMSSMNTKAVTLTTILFQCTLTECCTQC